ncbi:pyruvate kinase [Actinopolymorpha singaporensis]|uniref:Pyruvate kinase n=1 Tax=Actinopolymorpha singaporensis TaxID=117157 RepID=A0A1H1WYN7_9ACTN|nr:pyruvate kinase [Actinopolymorpha singaporensis]SDT02233.1 pyruvate kinase [Actinopolymorpha singaporensis]
MRRAKIVCTFGPATSTPERIRELVDAGLDVARLNLSHGTYAEHERIYRMIREAAEESGRGVGVLVDLQGPKIRLGKFAEGSANLVYGDRFTITTDECPGDAARASTTYDGLPGDVGPGDRILVDDGRLMLEVEEVKGADVVTRVLIGGKVSDHKGLNLPGVGLSVPAMSEKDHEDLRWALRLRADMIALSFVRSARDVEDVRRVMTEEGVRLPVIAKIEKPQAVQNLEEIIDAFDAFMVARGDLGVEMPLEDVPLVQKRIVELARTNAKPVIVATQMLESMVNAARPTRAEASDVANAVLDGTDAVMLSGETSVGIYPIEAVRTMARIVETTEEHGLDRMAGIDWEPRTKGGVIAKAAAEVAERLGAKFLVAFTQSGDTARRLARYRSRVPLLAFTPEEIVRQQLALTWGVETFLVPTVSHTDEMVKQVDRALLAVGRCRRGDSVVIVAGSPPGIPGSTNALRVHRIGDAVAQAAPAYRV